MPGLRVVEEMLIPLVTSELIMVIVQSGWLRATIDGEARGIPSFLYFCLPSLEAKDGLIVGQQLP